MTGSSLDILVISDLHYLREADHTHPLEKRKRKSLFGPVLLRKALRRLQYEGVEVGLVIILGDVVDNHLADGAEKDLVAVAKETQNLDLPVLAVPGNHDGDFERFATILGCGPGLHKVGGYGFLLFHDHVDEGDVATRPSEELGLPSEVASEHPGLGLVALQQNPLHPHIESDYPYMLTNANAILSSYEEAGVILSLSGHYHAGQPAHRVGNVTCCTVPAACESPFRFAHVRLRDREVQVREHSLRMDTPGLVDMHCHTEYAYCAATVTAESNVEVARAMGLQGLYLIEHAFQLYFDEDDAWSFRWQTDADFVQKAWETGQGRMPEYRRFVQGLRNDYVRLGLEVDLCADGDLLLTKEDQQGWDLLVGAIHKIPGFEKGRTTQAEAEKLFLREIERLLAHPIQVLAHPFRFLLHAGLQRPTRLYETVARLLSQSGVAAELNFHGNEPDPRFVETCLSHGVKIALGTDSHDLAEVGELSPHIGVLRQAGVSDEDLPNVLYRPGRNRE